jgi:hypothetical protein
MTTEDVFGSRDHPSETLVRIRVLGPFCIGGKAQLIGSELHIAAHMALDLVSRGKAQLLDPQPEPARVPLKTFRHPVFRNGQ